MMTTFLYTLRRQRLAIFGWGIGLALLMAMVVLIYESIVPKLELIDQLMAGLPPIVVALAGEAADFMTPGGWLHMKFFATLPVLFGFYWVIAGAGLFAADEERGRLDLLLAYPVSRARVFWGRVLALVISSVFILAICWLGLVIALPFSVLKMGFADTPTPFLSTMAPLLFFEALALVFAMVLPSRIIAAGLAGVILIANFFVELLATVSDWLLPLARCLPLHYFQGGLAVGQFRVGQHLALVGVAMVLFGIAWRLFERQDIRVMGEGSWWWR
jgi:ABC-2 type transport system permease protein